MGQKKRWEKLLNELEKILGGVADSEVSVAVSLLRQKVSELPEALPREKLVHEGGGGAQREYPVPTQVHRPDQVALFSDGACRGNPGPGSWGAIGQSFTGEIWFEATGLETHTTNNRMELLGAIQALQSLHNVLHEKHLLAEQTEVYLFTDSNLVVQAVNQWMHDWQLRGWKKADGKDVANIDLWKMLAENITAFKRVEFCWIKGHAGHPQNERCDFLANQALDESGF